MKITFLSIAALASYSRSVDANANATATCPSNQYPEISSEDEYGRPYLDLFLCTSYALFSIHLQS